MLIILIGTCVSFFLLILVLVLVWLVLKFNKKSLQYLLDRLLPKKSKPEVACLNSDYSIFELDDFIMKDLISCNMNGTDGLKSVKSKLSKSLIFFRSKFYLSIFESPIARSNKRGPEKICRKIT
jgi:hypothetical protein